jgi:hypothetical protein
VQEICLEKQMQIKPFLLIIGKEFHARNLS